MKLLYIGANWPQPWITAAGVRTIQLIKAFKKLQWEVDFLSIKKPNTYQTKTIEELDIKYSFVPLNNEKSFKELVKDPTVCLFETSRVEEMFSHMLYNNFPQCKRIIDTQDLHCLRLERKKTLEQGKNIKEVLKTELDWKDELTCREFAGILRSNSIILTSNYEKSLIYKLFPGVNSVVLPFFYEKKLIIRNQEEFSNNNRRNHFVWLGNFSHEPNKDSLDFMLKEIWPKIYKELNCEFHIYGANPPDADKYNSPGVVFKGSMKSLKELSKYKCMLAYLRFGAGIKGKIIDSFFYGLPVITTSIGAESIVPFPGFIADAVEDFISTAIRHYRSDDLYKFQRKAFELLDAEFSDETNTIKLRNHLDSLKSHPMQNILNSETIRSSFYFSKYIEAKATKKLT